MTLTIEWRSLIINRTRHDEGKKWEMTGEVHMNQLKPLWDVGPFVIKHM